MPVSPSSYPLSEKGAISGVTVRIAIALIAFRAFPFSSEISPFFDLAYNALLRYSGCSAGERCTTPNPIWPLIAAITTLALYNLYTAQIRDKES